MFNKSILIYLNILNSNRKNIFYTCKYILKYLILAAFLYFSQILNISKYIFIGNIYLYLFPLHVNTFIYQTM